MECRVYGLASTSDGVIRYIGQTGKSIQGRYASHLRSARNQNCKSSLASWIRHQWQTNNGVLLVLIDGNAVWNETERALIATAKAAGHWLVNTRPGGTWVNSDYDGVRAKMSVTFMASSYRHARREKAA